MHYRFFREKDDISKGLRHRDLIFFCIHYAMAKVIGNIDNTRFPWNGKERKLIFITEIFEVIRHRLNIGTYIQNETRGMVPNEFFHKSYNFV